MLKQQKYYRFNYKFNNIVFNSYFLICCHRIIKNCAKFRRCQFWFFIDWIYIFFVHFRCYELLICDDELLIADIVYKLFIFHFFAPRFLYRLKFYKRKIDKFFYLPIFLIYILVLFALSLIFLHIAAVPSFFKSPL